MHLRKLLGLKRPEPKQIKRVLAKVYPFTPSPRAFEKSGAGRLLVSLFEQRRESLLALCDEIARDAEFHKDIPRKTKSADTPHWNNGYLPAFDGMLLYTQLRLLNPKTYVEIGSGNSTKFARRAIRDHGLRTKIISIDPTPRAEIDTLCDTIIRAPFQEVGEKIIEQLSPGDMLFQDGSHHIFTNTDATVFFTEVMPLLPAGVTYGIHDIFLPLDYPKQWYRRFYNEQYLWAAHVLARGPDEIICPAYWVSHDPEMRQRFAEAFKLPELSGSEPNGTSFWMRKA